MFWKTIKPLLSDKLCVEDRIGISQNQTKLLNNFFSNIVKNLNISRYSEVDSVARNMTDPTLRAKLKCKDHLSILAITSQCEANIIQILFISSLFKVSEYDATHKKGKKVLKQNYGPDRILPILSKVFESTMFAKMSHFFENFLSTQQSAFRKGCSTQHCLSAL